MKNETGVIIDDGAQDWQIFQQGRDGTADVKLRGRWLTGEPYRRAAVMARVVEQETYAPPARTLDWQRARTRADGTWSVTLRGVPRGGLYRIETGLRLDATPVEWLQRGDMVHHVGVGDLWVITGQSNAAGYGRHPVADGPEPGVHMFHASGAWKLAAHPLGDSTRSRYPANREGGNASHSPFLHFAKVLRRQLGYPIGVIPAALGGSPLGAWVRGVDGHLFENMLAYVRDAGGKVRGVTWYQGESDTAPEPRQAYPQRFRRLVADLRRSLGDPALPVLTVQLSRYIGEPLSAPVHRDWEAMREVQRQIARRLPGVHVISTLDLGLSDGIHIDSGSNLTIGYRLASCALGAVYGRDVKYRHPDLASVRRTGASAIELAFDHVEERLHFENNIPEQFPFAVRDAAGPVPVAGWSLRGRNRIRIRLARKPGRGATVTGGPTASPPRIVPVDVCGFRPMLAFTARIPVS